MTCHLCFCAGLLSLGVLAGCATDAAAPPMTRAARSIFQPFQTEDGEARFVIQNAYLASESPERNRPYFDTWLQEWLREYDYCRQGYEILWTKTEPFVATPAFGGYLVTMARCR